MPDDMDVIQDRVLRETEEILAHRPQAGQGRSACIEDGCGEAITSTRTALGAQRCMDCQRAFDAREAHFRTWARR